jgi:hypothetical protein
VRPWAWQPIRVAGLQRPGIDGRELAGHSGEAGPADDAPEGWSSFQAGRPVGGRWRQPRCLAARPLILLSGSTPPRVVDGTAVSRSGESSSAAWTPLHEREKPWSSGLASGAVGRDVGQPPGWRWVGPWVARSQGAGGPRHDTTFDRPWCGPARPSTTAAAGTATVDSLAGRSVRRAGQARPVEAPRSGAPAPPGVREHAQCATSRHLGQRRQRCRRRPRPARPCSGLWQSP